MTGSANSSVRPPVLDLDRLVTFIGELRLLGFHVSTQQYIDAQNLLVALAARGLMPREPQRLRTMLAPLLCGSPSEQETFYLLYDRWFVPEETPTLLPDDPSGKCGYDANSNAVREKPRRQLPLTWLVVSAALLLAVPTFIVFKLLGWIGPAGVPVPGGTATQEAQGSWGFTYIGVSLLILSAALGAVWLLKKSHYHLQLEKWRSSQNPQLEQLIVRRPAEQLFNGAAFRSVIQQMRRHRRSDAISLDVPRTIDATVGKGGWFTPVYNSQQVLPEYLILIDRANYRDQQARLDVEIVNRLRENNVHFEQYYFQGDPRVCQREEPRTQRLSLQDLAALHPDYHLLIFSDGDGLLNPITGRPQQWLDVLSQWARRALLTPESPVNWGYREWALSGLDMSVLPANVDGMAALAHAIHMDNPPEVLSGYGMPPFPEMLEQRKERWLESLKPDPTVVERLCSQLRSFLDDEGYFWLTACAVYPALSWNLTLYFGYELTSRERFEERLSSLVRLPWFRHGTMPDWLRLKLISELPSESERRIRQKLEELLISSLEQPQNGFPLQFSPPNDTKWRGWKRLRGGLANLVNNRRRRSILQSILKTEPEDSILRDNVFLTFISGRKPSKLAVAIPQNLRNLLLSGRKQSRPAATPRNLFRPLLSVFPFARSKAKQGTANQSSLPLEHEWSLPPTHPRRRPAIIGGVVTGLLSSIPILGSCCFVWAIVGGIIASKLYVKHSTDILTASDGFKLGAMVGLIASVIYIPISALLRYIFLPAPAPSPDLPVNTLTVALIGGAIGAIFITIPSTVTCMVAVPRSSRRKEAGLLS